jgi:hypothetical protein
MLAFTRSIFYQGFEMNRKQVLLSTTLSLTTVIGVAFSQPPKAPTTPDAACESEAAALDAEKDTVVSVPDANGFYSIFDGKTLKGWWQDCATTHSADDRTLGAIFKVDVAHKAIYAMSREGVGGILATRKKYAHYELVFDWWPEFGNDGGVFNRMTYSGKSNQMVLDYVGNSGLLGMYSEGSFPGDRNQRPWSYITETTISIPGSGGDAGTASNWTTLTKALNPTKLGCSVNGCAQADLMRLWNIDGWNQIREVYYGGLTNNQSVNGDKIHTFSYFRKFYPIDTTVSDWVPGVTDTAQWIPVLRDSLVLLGSDPAGSPKSWLGFQVHKSASRYKYASKGGLGSWYRNIKIRELDEKGMPLYVTALSPERNRKVTYDMQVISNALVGSMKWDHVITFSDVNGKILDQISGMAGSNLHYSLPNQAGVIIAQVMTSRGTQNLKINPTKP